MQSSRDNRSLADFYSAVYRKGEKRHWTRMLVKRAGESLPVDEEQVLRSARWTGKTVLDVGCGTGLMCAVAAQAGARQVVGIDYAEAGIALAREQHRHPVLEFRVEDVRNHRGRYDIIVSLGTLEHMDDPLATLRQLKKHLNPGGKIILTCPNWTNARGYILQALRMLFDAPITLADLHYLTPIEFEAWARKLRMKLAWKTFDHDWGHGEKLIKDFERRLPNVLIRDMKMEGIEPRIAEFLDWLRTHVVPVERPTKWSGAVGLYRLQ